MRILYTIDTASRKENIIDVEISAEDVHEKFMDVILPVWVPGSYVIRDYVRNVRSFTVTDQDNEHVRFYKTDKSRWRIVSDGLSAIRAKYRICNSDVIPQASSADDSHVYVLGASSLAYIDGYADQSVEVRIKSYDGDMVHTNLETLPDGNYSAPNYDVLADSIFEIGKPGFRSFTHLERKHELVFCGFPEKYIVPVTDTAMKVVKYVAGLFSFLPYKRYVFFFHMTGGKGGGGHEHANCSSITIGCETIKEGGPEELSSIIAHEFFHVYNVKRIRPVEFENFNYRSENYTTLLWFSEGFTSFYTNLILYRSSVVDREKFLHLLAEQIRSYMILPGKDAISSSQSSFDAWIRLYKPSADDFNSYISYYLKGSMLALVLDIMIILNTNGESTIDDLMIFMWEKYRKDGKGFSMKDIMQFFRELFSIDLTNFAESYIDGVATLPVMEYMNRIGYELTKQYSEKGTAATTGLLVRFTSGNLTVVTPVRGYPSYGSGISPGDRLVSFNGNEYGQNNMRPVMGRGNSMIHMDSYSGVKPGDVVNITVERRGLLKKYSITATEPPCDAYDIRARGDQTSMRLTSILERGNL